MNDAALAAAIAAPGARTSLFLRVFSMFPLLVVAKAAGPA
jgi:hypothetical protein